MSTNVTMPSMGFDMTEGKVARWLKAVGDAVERGETIGEIETEKATVDLSAPVAGVLAQIIVQAGETVPVNTPIAIIAAAGEEVPASAPQGSPGEKQKEGAQPTATAEPEQASVGDAGKRTAEAGEGGTRVATGQGAPEETAAIEIGKQGELEKQEEGSPATSTVTPTQETGGVGGAAAKPGAAATQLGGDGQGDGRIRVSPLARNTAEAEGIDLRSVRGSGPDGRIIQRDIQAVIEARKKGAPMRAPAVAATPAGRPAPSPAPAQPPAAKPAQSPVAPAAPAALVEGEQPLTRMRQAIARRLLESKTTIPHYYLTIEVMMGEAMKLRAQLNAMAAGDADKLSVNDLIVAAAARTLRKFPNVNAYFKGDRIELHAHINVGVAVAVEDGLLTPVLHDADQKSLKQIAIETKELAARARANKMKPEDLGPGTFTISNLGMYGIDEFAAIINPPELAILAVGAVKAMPVVVDDSITVAQVMKATLSADHRIVDGALGARFLQELKKLLENPVNLLLS